MTSILRVFGDFFTRWFRSARSYSLNRIQSPEKTNPALFGSPAKTNPNQKSGCNNEPRKPKPMGVGIKGIWMVAEEGNKDTPPAPAGFDSVDQTEERHRFGTGRAVTTY
jgi:hypothetical protein